MLQADQSTIESKPDKHSLNMKISMVAKYRAQIMKPLVHKIL